MGKFSFSLPEASYSTLESTSLPLPLFWGKVPESQLIPCLLLPSPSPPPPPESAACPLPCCSHILPDAPGTFVVPLGLRAQPRPEPLRWPPFLPPASLDAWLSLLSSCPGSPCPPPPHSTELRVGAGPPASRASSRASCFSHGLRCCLGAWGPLPSCLAPRAAAAPPGAGPPSHSDAASQDSR